MHHILQNIIFCTTLSQKFASILTDMISDADSVTDIHFDGQCLHDQKARKTAPLAKKLLSVELH